MMKRSLRHWIALAFILCLFAAESRAQSADVAAREADWQNYKLPSSDFARYTDPMKVIAYRVPVEWKQQEEGQVFVSGDGVELKVVLDEIPEGVPLRSYVASVLQGVRQAAIGSDEVVVRRTQMSGLEAREIVFEMADERGSLKRAVIWIAVEGPRAVSFVFTAPIGRAAQSEAHFKAVVESAIIFGNMWKLEQLRSSASLEDKPGRIDEMLLLIPDLDGLNTQARAKALARLAKMFAESPDFVADLTEDPRPMVRAAALEAIGLSRNEVLEGFLLSALNDPDAFVAERAAKSLFSLVPGTAKLLRDSLNAPMSFGHHKALRAIALADDETRAGVIVDLFKRTKPPLIIPLPPPPPARSARKKVPPPPAQPPGGMIATAVGKGVGPDLTKFPDLDRSTLALILLRGVASADVKIPIDDIIADGNNVTLSLALEIAFDRKEQLPAETLFKLLDSPSKEVRRLAAINLGESASVSDIARIEARAEKLSSDSSATDKTKNEDKENAMPLAFELRRSIKIIRLRDELAGAVGDLRKQLINRAMSDKEIADWVWLRFIRDRDTTLASQKHAAGASGQIQSAQIQSADRQNEQKRVEIAPLGENIFPANATLYAALPNPAQALGKLGDALSGLQLETAQTQANLTFMLNAFKAQMEQFVGAQPESSALDYLGIKMNRPIAMAKWFAEDAPRGSTVATRKALLLRVSDTDRFEHLLALYQRQMGGFANFTDYFSAGARFIGIAPIMLPYGAYAVLKEGVALPKEPRKFSLNYIGRAQCQGYPVKIFERLEMSPTRMMREPIYLAYVGDAALMASDWDSLNDALARLSSGRGVLAENADFKRAAATNGDAIYFSNLLELFGSYSEKKESEKKENEKLSESGALKISDQVWENSYNFSFKQSDWSRPLAAFHPGSLASPRDLLPRSTLAYFFMKLDAQSMWQQWAADMLGQDAVKDMASIWAMDFEKEVLPETGPEAGAALLGFPASEGSEWNLPSIIFFKLKTDKLARAFAEGRLLKSAAAAVRSSRVKFGSFEMFVTIKNGYLIFATNEATLDRLDSKEKLYLARDFERAAKNAPDGIIAFGGYNLEAAIAEVVAPPGDANGALMVGVLTSLARAFHSQSLYATATPDSLSARMSVSLDREGRYSVAELSSLSKDFRLSFAMVEPKGVPIFNQRMVENLKLRIRATATGEIDRIKEDLTIENQAVEKLTENELVVNVRPRRADSVGKAELPITGAEFAPYLKPSREIRSDDKTVIEKAREIAGDDRDAWSVARKLGDWTFKNLKWKRVDSADAVDTLATKEADCLEFSQLFVAMARSLGLPARIVSGMAYGDGSFGGHAWVEVYAGRWIELDPTWGTDFVDATHVRSAAGEMISYAALNLVSIEVMEAPRAVADYQRDAKLLAEKICEQWGDETHTALTASIDMAALADEHTGAGTWAKMSDREREQLWSSVPKLITHLTNSADMIGDEARLLKMKQTADRAEAMIIVEDYADGALVKLELARKGDAWILADMIDVETDSRIASERLRPMVGKIIAQRDGKQKGATGYSDLERTFIMLRAGDGAGALEVLQPLLKQEPRNRTLRHLKALSLSASEKTDEALKIWTELSEEEPPFAPALYALSSHYGESEQEADKKKAAQLRARYAALVDYDPRPHTALALFREKMKQFADAEASYRAAIERDPKNYGLRLDFADMLATIARYDEALAIADESAQASGVEDGFAYFLTHLNTNGHPDAVIAMAAAYPKRIANNVEAHAQMAEAHMTAERAREALLVLKRAIEIKKDYTPAHIMMAEAYRKLSNWTAALAAANAAIQIDAENAQAHYNRACALARLRRTTEALAALGQAIKLNPYTAYIITEEPDFKTIKGLPGFIKLIPKEEEEGEDK